MNPALIGILGATYPVMRFIGAPILGGLSARYGRKPILIFSQIGTLIGGALFQWREPARSPSSGG